LEFPERAGPNATPARIENPLAIDWPERVSRHADVSERSVVRVTIGRIDVRAIMPPAPAPADEQRRLEPALSLDEYLRRYNERRS